MNPNGFSFTLHKTATDCRARRATFQTPHGAVEMPAFMPVGTLGTVKGLTIDQIRATGAQMVLSNTYHLALRPGEQLIEQLGGLHSFMGWPGPILTDSGGFQVFSLAQSVKVTEQQAVFRSHIDGTPMELSPERAIAIQESLGSDIAMVLDHVVALPSPIELVREATERSVRWAERCQNAARRSDQAQFAIVQGGLEADLRVWSAEQLAKLDFPGYAIGGLSVGETPAEMYRVLDATMPAMPVNKQRYLMGVGRPIDLLEAISRGVDLFDCVLPTRNGRNSMAYTDQGYLKLRNRQYATDPRPLEEGCPCPACRHSRAYLRHLFISHEMLGPILLTAHNLTYYQRLLERARTAIEQDRFGQFYQAQVAGWQELAAADDQSEGEIDS
ncbi:MAG: tRNA guanosine(34) transglycosylase Tgt [Planctomycetota bacterium]|nr:tRNA guanosine(34) transglycosylase Tgt [Planctomycetota bacterium]